MSLRQVFRKESAFLVVIIAVVLLLAPSLMVTAYGPEHPTQTTETHVTHTETHTSVTHTETHTTHKETHTNTKTYPLGTVCGNALAGAYTISPFSGTSSFREWGVSFTLSSMTLSGGPSGKVTTGSGSAAITGQGGKIVSVTFNSVSGTYQIVGGSMHMKFSVTGLSLDSVPIGSPDLPPVTMSCNTPEIGS